MSLSHLPSSLHDFALLLQTHVIPTSTTEALSHLEWKKAMDVKMKALMSRQTWSFNLLLGKDVVKCRWVYTIKYNLDGSIEGLKARLIVKGFTQTYGMDYLSLIPLWHVSILFMLLFFFTMDFDWPLYQLNVKNAFLYDDLSEKVYMVQPPEYVAQGENRSKVCWLT